MSEYPIIFSGDAPLAILDGRKTQTRRVIKPQPAFCRMPGDTVPCFVWWRKGVENSAKCPAIPKDRALEFCPYGKPGDALWVRETAGLKSIENPSTFSLRYKADGQRLAYALGRYEPYSFIKWTPSIHMPRWACRLRLEVLNVRVERVREIQGHDIMHEGIGKGGLADDFADDYHEFARLWDKLNAKRGYGWDVNPWVWVIEFKRIKGAKDGDGIQD